MTAATGTPMTAARPMRMRRLRVTMAETGMPVKRPRGAGSAARRQLKYTAAAVRSGGGSCGAARRRDEPEPCDQRRDKFGSMARVGPELDDAVLPLVMHAQRACVVAR